VLLCLKRFAALYILPAVSKAYLGLIEELPDVKGIVPTQKGGLLYL